MSMPNFDSLFNAFVTILVTIDPPGLAPLFLAVTAGMSREQRGQVSVRASVIGFGVLALFAIAGAGILSVFGITLPAFRVAGGFLLFFIAFEMVFERRQDRKEKISDVAITRDHIHNIAAFPLAIPLIAGPGAISATVLLSGSFQGVASRIALIAIISFAFFVIWELTAEHPVVDLSLFRMRNFTGGTIALAVGYGLYFGNLVLLPLWLQTQIGYTATDAGLVMAPVGLFAILLSPLTGKFLPHTDPRYIATAAFLTFALCFWMRSLSRSEARICR